MRLGDSVHLTAGGSILFLPPRSTHRSESPGRPGQSLQCARGGN
ncbi:hypothetical protein [Rhodoferax ferrireducens]